MQTNKHKINHYQNSMTIYTVDGLCGSGKTYGLGQYIKQHQLHQKFIITAPSKVLIDQIDDQLKGLGIEHCYKHYSSDDRSSNVPQQIMDRIAYINAIGQGVILCTQQVYPKLPFIENQAEWVLVVDEIPRIDTFHDPVLPYNHQLLSKFMQVKDSVGFESYELVFNDEAERMGHQHDDINALIRPIVDELLSEHYRCYTDKANWDRLILQGQISDDAVFDKGYGNERNKVYVLSLLQPSIYRGFAQVIMMGANFDASLLYKYWSEYCQVRFMQCNAIAHHLRYSQYSNGHRLTLRYLQEADWSKHGAQQLINGKTKTDYYAGLVSDAFSQKPFIYMTNQSDKTELANGIKAPVISHGINQYAHIDNIYFAPALNNQPKHTRMLVDLGFNALFIKRAMSYEVAHQAIMRTSLRNPDSQSAVMAIVVDKATAYSIAALFPGCQVGPMSGCVRKVKAATPSEMNSTNRLKKLIALRELNSVVLTAATDADYLINESQLVPGELLIRKSYIREKPNQIFPNHLNEVSVLDSKHITDDQELMSWEKLSTKSPYIGNGGQIFPNHLNEVSVLDSDHLTDESQLIPGELLIRKSYIREKPNQNLPEFLDLSMGVSFMSSIYNKTLASMDSSPMEFIKTMQSIHTNHIIQTKDESILFNGVKYKTEQSRALSNTDYASLVVVDIDNGDLSPEIFRDIFENQYKHSFFMCNSYSRSVDKPNNYRAVFFIKQVVNDDIYRDIQAYLQAILERCGYITCWPKDRAKHLAQNPNAKFSGIDLSKNHTASFFYIPCKVQDRLDFAFFWRCNLKDLIQLKRYAIDVEKVIQYTQDNQSKPTLVFEPANNTASTMLKPITDDGFIDYGAIKTLIKTGDYKHLGEHSTYGKMAASMQEAGFSEADFIELTPYISHSKTEQDARRYWQHWGKYRSITRGTLFYLLGVKQAA